MNIFAWIIFILGSITLCNGLSEHRSVFKSSVRHSMNKYETPKTKIPINLRLSSWELNLVNEALVDIMVSQCPSIHPEEADQFKTYISEQISVAPSHSSMNTEFLDTYGNLIKCLELAERDRMNKGQDDKLKYDLSQIDFESTNLSQVYTNPINKITHNQPAAVESQSSNDNNNQQTVKEDNERRLEVKSENEVNSQTQTEAIFNQNSITKEEKSHVLENLDVIVAAKPKIATATTTTESVTKPGLIDTVGHLFSNLYENTVSVFSWFGRKKRQTEIDDKKEILKLKQRVVLGMRRDIGNRILKINKPHKKTKSHRKFNKGNAGSIMSAKIHFNEMLDSIRFIAHTSCPAQLTPVKDFVNEAIKEVLWYIYRDLKNVEAEDQKLSVNLDLQNRVQKCVKTRET